MKEKEKGGWLPIVGADPADRGPFCGVKLVFAGLGYVIPQDEGPEGTGNLVPDVQRAGEAVRYTLREPGEIDLSAPDIAQWMEQAAGELEQTPETEGIVFWLYRQDTDEYLLYLPDQDRSLLEGGLTASEETEEDSEVCLVLAARTPENSEPVAPEETLYCFATTSDSWNGIRVRVILDGREQEVRKLTSIGDRLYSHGGDLYRPGPTGREPGHEPEDPEMSALRRDDGAAAAGISPAGKDRVGPGRSGQPAGRGAGCGYPVLFRLREAGIFPGRVV